MERHRVEVTVWTIPLLTRHLIDRAEAVVACVPPRNDPERALLDDLREAAEALSEALAAEVVERGPARPEGEG